MEPKLVRMVLTEKEVRDILTCIEYYQNDVDVKEMNEALEKIKVEISYQTGIPEYQEK